MVMKLENSSIDSPKVQIIKRKVNPKLLSGAYYARVKNSIKRSIRGDTELLIIEIIPKDSISEKWILESFLYLQRELTSIITIPKNTVDMKKEDFEEFERTFDASVVTLDSESRLNFFCISL